MNDSNTEHPFRDDSDSDIDFASDSDEYIPNEREGRLSSSSSSRSSSDENEETETVSTDPVVTVTARGDGRRGRGRGSKRRRVDEESWKWNNVTNEQFVPSFEYDFDTSRQGIQFNATNFSPLDYFTLFFPEAAIDLTVEETNRYAEKHKTNNIQDNRSWVKTDNVEIKAFIGLQIAMGLCVKPSVIDYWDTGFWINQTPYTKVMARTRYQVLLACLHFNDNDLRVERGNEGYDPLFKIKPLLDIVLPTFTEYFCPGRELSLDESMVKFKGRIHIKQYLPAKPTKWGFKVFVLADAKSHFCLKAKVYTGKDHNADPGVAETDNKTGAIVKELLEGFELKGHVVFTDSFYSAPALFRDLKERGIGACGTVRDCRKQFPAQIKAKNLKLKKGDGPVFYATEEKDMLAVSWFDTKRVNLISTVDGNETMQKTVRMKGRPEGRQITKPVLVENYNKNMGGVDHFDQLSGNYAYPHRSYKWYLPLFHFLVETAIVNAHVTYLSTSRENKMSAKKFRQEISLRLIEENVRRRNRNVASPSPRAPSQRLTERHFMDKYTRPKYKPDCVVCKSAGKRSQTCMYCPDCNVALCNIPCFRLYHNVENYKIVRQRQLLQQTPPPTPSSSSSSN